jgi:hypothetical protein
MIEIEPYFGLCRAGYLQALANKYGDFKVSYAWKNQDGDIIWSKHKSVMECWESEEGIRFLNRVNNRSSLDCEIRIDTDPAKDDTPEQAKDVFDNVCTTLDSKGIKYTGWSSGSRGYHIQIMFPSMNGDKVERMKLREYIIDLFKADRHKINDTSMLTLEWAPNNKTGKIKIPLRGDFTNWIEDW